jgi:hypothetical protein
VLIESKRFEDIKKGEYVLENAASDYSTIFNVMIPFTLLNSHKRIRMRNSDVRWLFKVIITRFLLNNNDEANYT